MRFLDALTSVLWGWPVLLLILLAGICCTVSTRGYQLRHAKSWLREAFSGSRSQFQALTAALAGSIGTGNIVGVAAAITVGGPGAIFWMWVSALFGMMTVFAENLLSARRREQDPHTHARGALRYLEPLSRPLAVLYAAGCCLSSLGMGNCTQTNACAASLARFGVPAPVTALCCALLIFFVAKGGLARAKTITEKLVPLMTLLFFAASLGVLWVFRGNLANALRSIFTGAFSFRAGAGGAAGAFLAMKTGVSRGIFTNEAGLGSSAFAYEGVERRTPEQFGRMGIFQVFLDTIVMCTVTGLCILCCRSPVLSGAQLTVFAYESAWGPIGGGVIALCTALFAIATVISWCCYGWEGLSYLTHGRGKTLYAAAASLAAFSGCLLPLSAVFQLSDAMNGLMAVPNCIALLLLQKELKRQTPGKPEACRRS